jgi:hypothetical protein
MSDLARRLGKLSDAQLTKLAHSLAPPPRTDDMLTVVQAELARRRAEQEAGPLLLAKLAAIAERLRQPMPAPHVPPAGSPDAAVPAQAAPSPPERPADSPVAPATGAQPAPAPSNVIRPYFGPKVFGIGRELVWHQGE